MTKHYLLAFLSMITINYAFAQGKIHGKTLDEAGAPVAFATVALVKSSDSTLVGGTVTDTTGQFFIASPPPGNYFLKFTAVGWEEENTPAFEVSGADFSKDLGTIKMKQDAQLLKEVDIVALRPTIVQKPDRMVVSVEGTVMAAGNNAFNVLSRAPGVYIDNDGNIMLNGRSGITVLIDGRPTNLSARELRNLLESMSAENLKDIEIITTPSAKYEAEGSSGIININLKKNTQTGLNGNINAAYAYNFKQHIFTYGGSLGYQTGKWNFTVNVDGSKRAGGREATFTRVFYNDSTTTYFDQTAEGNWQLSNPGAVRLGIDYRINNKHTIGTTNYYTNNTFNDEFITDTYIGESPGSPYNYILAINKGANHSQRYTGNLYYVFKIDTAGTRLTADLDYALSTGKGQADFFNYYTDIINNGSVTDLLHTESNSGYNIASARIDFMRPLTHDRNFEAGLRGSNVTSDNDFKFYFNNGSLVLDPLRTNRFYYTESIYAAYLNGSTPLGKKLTVQAGLRAEQTLSKGNSYTTGLVTERQYLDLFPSLFVQQKVSENYGLTYSYSRRLSRPNYGSLNPFRAYRDPYTWTEGNPYLRPQYTHSISVVQTIKKIYQVTVSYQYVRDVMSELPILDAANNITIYTTGNVSNGHNANLTGIIPYSITKWWDTQNTVLLYYNKYTLSTGTSQVVNDQLSWSVQSNHTLLLPWDLRMEVSLQYRSAQAYGLYHMGATNRVDAGLKKSFANKKLDLTINANDIFKGSRFVWSTRINGNINDFDQYFRFRTIGASLRYNFSKGQKVQQQKQRNTLEELNRT